MLFIVIEHFRDGNPVPVYRRYSERGRLAPDGLRYVASWVTEDLVRYFQVMECEDPSLLLQWTVQWEDRVEFEIVRVMSSPEAAHAAETLEARPSNQG